MQKNTKGYLYILSNPIYPGLFKVGYTTRYINKRIEELSSTGVPDDFRLELYYELDNPEIAENKVHSALSQYRYKKEFFKLPLKDLVKVYKDTIYSSDLLIYKIEGPANSLYYTNDEINQIKKHNLDIESANKEKEREELKRNTEIAKQRIIFLNLAPLVNAIVQKNDTTTTGKKILGGFLILSVIGGSLADKIDPPPYMLGEKIAKELNASQIEVIKKFKICIDKLMDLDGLEEIAKEAREKYYGEMNDMLIDLSWKSYTPRIGEPSRVLRGIFNAL
jgi:hypothetical protein